MRFGIAFGSYQSDLDQADICRDFTERARVAQASNYATNATSAGASRASVTTCRSSSCSRTASSSMRQPGRGDGAGAVLPRGVRRRDDVVHGRLAQVWTPESPLKPSSASEG